MKRVLKGILVIILGIIPTLFGIVGWIAINMIMKPQLLPVIIVAILLFANSCVMIYIAMTKYFMQKQRHIIELETALNELCNEIEKPDVLPYPDKRVELTNNLAIKLQKIYEALQKTKVEKRKNWIKIVDIQVSKEMYHGLVLKDNEKD